MPPPVRTSSGSPSNSRSSAREWLIADGVTRDRRAAPVTLHSWSSESRATADSGSRRRDRRASYRHAHGRRPYQLSPHRRQGRPPRDQRRPRRSAPGADGDSGRALGDASPFAPRQGLQFRKALSLVVRIPFRVGEVAGRVRTGGVGDRMGCNGSKPESPLLPVRLTCRPRKLVTTRGPSTWASAQDFPKKSNGTVCRPGVRSRSSLA